MSSRHPVQIRSLVRDGKLIYNDGYRTKSSELSSRGLPILRVSQINDGRIIGNPSDFIDPAYDKKIGEKKSQIGDVVLTTKGTIGRIARIKDETEVGYAYSPQVIWSRANDSILSKFLFYALQSRYVKNQLRVLSEQTDMAPYVNLHDFGLVEILMPSEMVQDAIAEVLSSLDDKIDLLKRQNKTLEGMAEALFRQWFIEEAQDDWEEVPFGEFLEIHDQKRIPKSSMERAHMKDGVLFPYYGAAHVMDYVNDFIFDFDSVLVGEDGSVVDEEGFAIIQTAFGKYWVNNHAHVLTPKRGLNLFGLWSFFRVSPIQHAVTGAVQPKLNQKNLKALLFRVPEKRVFTRFSEATDTLWDKRKANILAIKLLEKKRDTLLPKLMSGEVRVKLD